MDLNKFKKEVDEEIVAEAEIKDLKKKAINKFEDFFNITKKSGPLWDDKMKSSVDEFIHEFVNYMEENGFSVDCKDPKITETEYKQINAIYNGKVISLNGLNYDGEKMWLMVNPDYAIEFWFDLQNEAPRYRYWKDNVVVSGKCLHDFGKPVNQSYVDFVNYFNTKEELHEVIEKVQINIDHFNDSIKDIDKYDFYINKFGTDDTYSNFKEFIDSVEI